MGPMHYCGMGVSPMHLESHGRDAHATLSQARRGFVLIVAMVVTFALAGMVLVLCRSMRVEMLASANAAAAVQASAVERGAEQYVLGMLADQGPAVSDLGEDQFSEIQVGDGYFWIVRPNYDDSSMPVFGLMEESGKLNLNNATPDQLLQLPGMTDEIAGAIVDWRDTDSDLSPNGAENAYYLSLPEPYYCKNSNFETIEELLMVRGITRALLYGDGSAPPLGTDPSSISTGGAFTTDPQLARGIYDLLTVYSREPRTTPSSLRIDIRKVDDSDKKNLDQLMTAQGFTPSRIKQILKRVGKRYDDIFAFYFDTKMTRDEFDKVINNITAGDPSRRGLININKAPREVLLCLGLDPSDVDKLIAQRQAFANSASITWVADVLGSKVSKLQLATKLTTRTYQYSADIVAVSGNGRAFKHCRIVVDLRSGAPLIVYRRELTDRGWPMDKQILASLRQGRSMGAIQ